MKKTAKIVGIMMIAIALLVSFTTVSNATSSRGDIDASDIAGQLKGTPSTAQGDLTDIGNKLIGIITTVGVVVAVVVLLVLGIKYMMGSASEKAEYKKTMIPYLVGAILIFGASAITKVVVGLAQGITG